jgi:hypothetical protein
MCVLIYRLSQIMTTLLAALEPKGVLAVRFFFVLPQLVLLPLRLL